MEETKKYTGNEDCCFDCGIPFLTDKQKQRGGAVTTHKGTCCVCGEEKTVTSIRHYNYLEQQTVKQ